MPGSCKDEEMFKAEISNYSEMILNNAKSCQTWVFVSIKSVFFSENNVKNSLGPSNEMHC